MAKEEQAIALATDATTKLTSRQRRASIVSVPEIVKSLQEQQARAKDYLVPAGKMRAERVGAEMRVKVGTEGTFRMYDRVLPQLCGATTVDGVHAPGAFMRQLLTSGKDAKQRETFIDLAAHNINTLLKERAVSEKAHFVRALLDDDNQPVIRAVLSERYLPLSSLDMVIAALGVVTGKIKTDKIDGGFAQGARAFDYHLDPFRLSVGFVNPGYAFDLKNPQRGLIKAETKQDDHGWVYPGGGKFEMSRQTGKQDGTHLVFPACYISNSDTGGGSATVEQCILEAACINTARVGVASTKRHLGGIMDTDTFDSETTQRKLRELFLSRVVDGLTQVFDPEAFVTNCQKFLKLAETPVKDVVQMGKKLFESGLPGGEAMLAEFLKRYEQMTPGKDTLLDVQRALTNTAQDQKPDVQCTLETFAGRMIEKGEVAVKELKKLVEINA